MVVKLKSLASDLTRENDGEWVPSTKWEGVRFRIRSTNYKPFCIEQNKLLRRMAQQNRTKPIDPDDSQAEIGRLFAKHILLDWEGLDEKYTPDRAEDVLTNPEYREVAQEIENCALVVGKNAIEFTEELTKN